MKSGVLHLGVSDHSLVYGCFKLAIPKQDPKFIKTRMFKYHDKEYFTCDLCAILSKLNWDSKDPNKLWTNFKESFNSASEIDAPTRYRRVRSEYVP